MCYVACVAYMVLSFHLNIINYVMCPTLEEVKIEIIGFADTHNEQGN